jgi:hypothetical protein
VVAEENVIVVISDGPKMAVAVGISALDQFAAASQFPDTGVPSQVASWACTATVPRERPTSSTDIVSRSLRGKELRLSTAPEFPGTLPIALRVSICSLRPLLLF